MARIPLIGKAYQERSVIASAQETINLYAESNAEDAQAPSPVTYYPTPGLVLLATPNPAGECRCTYRTSIGTAYTVIANKVYQLTAGNALVFIGTIGNLQSQVYMADNGSALVIVDGSVNGYAINLATNAFAPIIDVSFFGADFVVFQDTFFIFNRPKTNQFYISLSNVTYALLTAGVSFDPLDIAAKSGSADPIVAILSIHDELWLIGALTTEVWVGTGAADFFYQRVQGAYIEHGCIAPYSASNTDVVGIWLMQDKQGKNIVVEGSGYTLNEISTPYLVDRFNNYATTVDAIGFFFQIGAHAFYTLMFPTANETWLYSLKAKMWFRWCWLNIDTGSLNRHRSNCAMFFNGQNIVGDWETGKLYALNLEIYLDDTTPILRRKTFCHMLNDMNRVAYRNFDADMEVGEQDPAIDVEPMVSLSWSDNRGVSYGMPVEQSLGEGGEFFKSVTWNRLGMARDRVFKLEWSAPIKTALNGGFCEVTPARS